jgi:hypothetical protein
VASYLATALLVDRLGAFYLIGHLTHLLSGARIAAATGNRSSVCGKRTAAVTMESKILLIVESKNIVEADIYLNRLCRFMKRLASGLKRI